MLYNPEWKPPVAPAPEVKASPERLCLLRAADLIRTKGHCKGHYKKNGRHCILGALRDVGINELMTTQQVLGVVAEVAGRNVVYLSVWNDAPERTAEEVITVMERAAAKL